MIAQQRFETGAFFDKSGKMLLFKDGEAQEVQFTDDEMAGIRGQAAIFTHNHPQGWRHPPTDPRHESNSFALDDVILAVRVDLEELRAITPVWRYTMQRPAAGWPAEGDLRTAFALTEELVLQELFAAARGGTVPIEEAMSGQLHPVWERLAPLLLIRYQRQRR